MQLPQTVDARVRSASAARVWQPAPMASLSVPRVTPVQLHTVVPAGQAATLALSAAARADERVAPALEGKTVRKVVVVPGKLINFVVG